MAPEEAAPRLRGEKTAKASRVVPKKKRLSLSEIFGEETDRQEWDAASRSYRAVISNGLCDVRSARLEFEGAEKVRHRTFGDANDVDFPEARHWGGGRA